MKTEILEHDIKWHVGDENITELDSATIEHIEQSIKEGCTSGQIVMDETTGWWEIVNWQDIACELYNALNGDKKGKDKAAKRFNENW